MGDVINGKGLVVQSEESQSYDTVNVIAEERLNEQQMRKTCEYAFSGQYMYCISIR